MKFLEPSNRLRRNPSPAGWALACILIALPLYSRTESKSVRLLQNSSNGCTVEFRLNGFSLDTLRIESKDYVKAGFQGALHTAVPGDPMVPYAVAILGVPPEGDVRVSVSLSEPARQLEGVRLCPARRTERQDDFPVEVIFEGETYQKRAVIPGTVFYMEDPEWFGPYRIVRIKIYPVQYNPIDGSLQILSRIVLSAEFNGQANAAPADKPSADEAVYRGALLNYSTARQWRVRNAQPLAKAPRPFGAGQHYKIPISTEGLYQITGAFLANAGIDISGIDPATLKVYNNGGEPLPKLTEPRPDSLIENPIQLTGMEDNRFDPTDYILFYAKGPSGVRYSAAEKQFTHYVNPFVLENVYWLVFNDGLDGKRIGRSSASAGSGQPPFDWFTDCAYFQHDIENPIKAGMFWDSHTFETTNPDWTLDLPVFDPVVGDTASFRIQVKGGDQGAGVLDVAINDLPVSAISVFSFNKLPYKKIYPEGLSSGGNVISFHFKPSTLASTAHLGWIEIEYKRMLRARNGALRFYSPLNRGSFDCRLSGFSQEPFVWDVSDLFDIRAIPVTQDNDGYLMTDTFDPPLPRTYYAQTGFKTPGSIQQVTWTNLRDPDREGELLIITHGDFYDQALRYRQFKETFDSLTVFLANVQDVYDNFSCGLQDPAAIRDFVKYAFDHWKKPPAYLLLVGDGHYDYRTLTPDASPNKIPPYEVDGLKKDDAKAMDDYYTYVSAPNQMALSVGRLTVQTADEAKTVFDKLIDYQSNPDRGDWRSLITVVADDAFNLGKDNEPNHTVASENLAEDIIPHSFNIRKIYMTEYPMEIRTRRLKPGAENDIVDQINQGTLIINYTGHANRTVWASEWVFQHKTDLNRLHNEARLPLFYTATCEFGLYDDPAQQHFAEDLLASPGKGGIAIIGASRFCNASPNEALNREFMDALLRDPGTRYRLGDAFRIGKLRTSVNRENNEQYHILGDPSMRLAVPRRQLAFTLMEPDSFKALGLVRVGGEVLQNGSVWTGFNGNILLRAFDSKKPTRYLTDEQYPETISYLLPGNPLFRGESKVESGRFEVQFIVPKDISYGGDLGRLSGYVWNESTDGFGYRDNIASGGSSRIEDQHGPDIRLSFGQRDGFVSGDMVSEDPELAAVFEDDRSGINLTGEIGHKITLTLDDKPPVDVSEYFQYDQGSYLKGRIVYKMSGTPPGAHQMTVKAWDNANNSSSQTLEFRVVPGGALFLEKVVNYPNPMSDGTQFTFEINESAEVEIKIFTVDGRRIGKIDRFWAQPGFNAVAWDGRDETGDGLSNGVYLYKVIARNKLQGKDVEASAIGKLIVMQ
jgi:hypothetical protein